MQWMLPGSVIDEKPTSATSTSTIRSSLVPAKVLHTDIWELVSGAWTVTHQFDTGLELDAQSELPAHVKQSRVHLPSTSLRSLQQLRSMLMRPGAILLDVTATSQPITTVFSLLLDQLSDVMTPESRVEAMSTLRPREAAVRQVQLTDINEELQSVNSEDLIAPQKGTEAVDIQICPLRSLTLAVPVVALARLSMAVDFGAHQSVPVRYAMLVVCSLIGPEAVELAREAARAFATAVMDEDFASALILREGGTESILKAFDAYLSNVTIVPTVYMQPTSAEADEAQFVEQSECLLSDSIVGGIEKLISKSRSRSECHIDVTKRHHQIMDVAHPPERRQRFFVDVHTTRPGSKWHLTRRLMQGLEVDAMTQTARPHLPHVSVIALARARQLLTPASIGLDIAAGDAQAAVEGVVRQLSAAGLPALAIVELTTALRELIGGQAAGLPSTTLKDLGLAASEKLLEPTDGQEACHVLAITCQHFPRGHPLVGAFVRIKSPLCLQLASASVPARFFLALVGCEAAESELLSISDSLAALSTDEDLMGDLTAVGDVDAFIRAFDARLNNLTIVPHARVSSANTPRDKHHHHHCPEPVPAGDAAGGGMPSNGQHFSVRWVLSRMQKYSVPLIVGVVTALIWSNVHMDSYLLITRGAFWNGAHFQGHPLTMKFIVNDIFMCFFFGLAVKEVAEALLPGGSLSPLKRAVNPLMATLGGIVGPAVAYVALVLVLYATGSFDGTMCSSAVEDAGGGHRRRLGGNPGAGGNQVESEACELSVLIRGWGVPTATDISLAWMFALQIFGPGHPAINFLLLLAIVDDAIGMGIIAIYYSDPDHPVEPIWLLLVLAAIVLSFGLRKLRVPCWQVYVFVAGPVSWLGLLKAHVHPALALVAVVPLMPASHAIAAHGDAPDLGACDLGPSDSGTHGKAREVAQHFDVPQMHRSRSAAIAAKILATYHAEEAPLHVFEHSMKLPVDMGMFFFGLANAGVKLNNVGGITTSVIFALLVGKTLGIAFFGLLAVCLGFGLPAGVTTVDLFAMSAVGGVGLTVALFVANQAFVDPGLQGQAKFGAVLSVLGAVLAWAIKAAPSLCNKSHDKEAVMMLEGAVSVKPTIDLRPRSEANADLIEDCLVDDILHVMWLQRRYAARGSAWVIHSAAKTPTNAEAGGRCHSSGGLVAPCATPLRSPHGPRHASKGHSALDASMLP